MRIQRRVIARKSQQLVAIPAAVRDHLGLVAGAAVFWHLTARGSAVLTSSGRARGGKPRLDADCPSCAKYRDELDRLRNALRSSSVPSYNEAIRDGWAQAMRHYTRLDGDVLTLSEKIDALRVMIASGVRVRATPRRRPSPSAPPPSSDVSAGEAVTPGVQPPGNPRNTYAGRRRAAAVCGAVPAR
jgi:hypothetical protein